MIVSYRGGCALDLAPPDEPKSILKDSPPALRSKLFISVGADFAVPLRVCEIRSVQVVFTAAKIMQRKLKIYMTG
jgi:hypothetical protein